MVAVISHLGRQLAYRVLEFLIHWYPDSFRFAGGKFMDLLKDWDKTLALRITVRHWLQPLYQDRTFIGYILGPIFRTGRIVVALAVYLLAAGLAALLYAIWLIIPPFVIYKIITGIFNF